MTGDFLDGFYVRDAPDFEEWAGGQRERLRQMVLDALHRLAVHHISRGEYRAGADYLERLLSIDPWREDAHKQLMLLLAYEGRRDAAVAQYHACRRALVENLGEEPSEETTELYRRIRDGTIEIPTPQLPPGNLPSHLVQIIGREADLAHLEGLLEEPACRLLTLTGPGGVGKTQLALQLATNLADEFTGGTYFVSLSPVRDASLVPGTIAAALDIEELAGRAPLDALAAALQDRQMLLVIDNFEHLMAAAPVLSALLESASHLRLLVTSRARLRLRNEQVYEVAPLALPPLGDPALPEVVSRFPSVVMFTERANAARPGFAVTDANARAVAEICHRLEGLPLAIELAAARMSMLPAQALLARLENRLGVLTGGARDLPTRQQTLRATLEWSYDLLAEAQKEMFRTFSVFAGGCTLEAVEGVADDVRSAECRVPSEPELPGSSYSVLETLSALVDNSLVLRDEQTGGDVRFRMLETVREYALERLIAGGGEERAARSHAHYYLNLAQQAQSELRGPQQAEWLNLLEADHNNLRAALRWALDDGGQTAEAETGSPPTGAETGLEMGMRAAAGLGRFWEMRGHMSEGRQWLDDLLAQPGVAKPAARAIALRGAGILALGQGDLVRSAAFCEESLALYIKMDDKLGTAGVFNSLGNAKRELGDLDEAAALYERGLALYRELKDDLGIAVVLNNLGAAMHHRGDLARATELYEESLAIRRAADDARGIAYTLNKLGEVAHAGGDLVHAEALCRESLARRRDLDDKHGTALTLTALGAIVHDLGDDVEATALMEESLALCRELGEMWGIASALRILGSIACKRGEYDQAKQLYEESLDLFEENGDKRGLELVRADLEALDRCKARNEI